MVSFLSDEGEVRVTDIAARLGVSKPSVINALKNLKEQGLLEHEPYRSVALTRKGAARAKVIRGKHNFLSVFLQNVVGVSPAIAEKDACAMEHILSGETLEKMHRLARAQAEKAGQNAAPPL